MLWAPLPLKEYNKMTAEKQMRAYIFFSQHLVLSLRYLPRCQKNAATLGLGSLGGWKTQALRENQAAKSLKSVPFCIYG